MSRRPSALVRALLATYRGLSALMPRGFRDDFLAAALPDLEQSLGHARERGGVVATLWAGTAALLDLTLRLPVEWRAARRQRQTNARRDGLDIGEMTMGMMNDFRLAARALFRRPGFTAAAVMTLALGIGANVAIFTVVNAVLIQPLPYPDSERIVSITHHAPAIDLPDLNHSAGTLNFYWDEGEVFSSLAGYDVASRNLVGGPQPVQVTVVRATPEIFDVLRVQPFMGRPFNAEDVVPDAPPAVLVLAHDAWQSLLGGDPDALGSTFELDGQVMEVVGVMPQGFKFPNPDVIGLVPMYVDPDGTFGTFGTSGLARLAPGVTFEEARQRVVDLQARLPEYFEDLTPEFFDGVGWSVTVETYRDDLVGDAASALWIILGTVGFVLLIACANVANLFLVRAESRQKELAIRAAMGAGRGRIAAGYLTEAVTLGIAGGIAGVALAWVGVEALVAGSPVSLARLHEVRMDGNVLAFAGMISVGVGLVFGAMPLLRPLGDGLAALLRDGGRANTAGRERHRTRSVLVASQLALALVLLVGSTLMLRSFQALRSVDPGIDPGNVTVVGLSVGDGVSTEEAVRFYTQVAEEVEALPSVVRAGLATAIPLRGNNWNGGSFNIRSRPRGDEELPPVAMYKAVDDGYLEIMGQPLLEGRNLEPSDWMGGSPVVMVNRAFADGPLEGQALGEGIHWGDSEDGNFADIVGVVGDVREFGLQEDVNPVGYLPLTVGAWGYPRMESIQLLVASPVGQDAPVAAIREIVGRLNPNVPLTDVQTMDEIVSESIADTSFTLLLLGIASVVALFLGAIGLFGVISYVVSQRTREIGVRVALGAASGDIHGMVFRQGAGVAVSGVVLGLLGAFALTRVMGAILFDVSALDPVAFIAAPLVLVGVAVTATWLPARRASRVDPMEALRSE